MNLGTLTKLPLLAILLALPVRGDDAPPSFASVLRETTLAQIEAVRDYVETHPEAADYEDALGWLLSSARNEGLEAEVRPIAEAYLERDAKERLAILDRLARSVRAIALAREGKGEAAVEEFETSLQDIPLRSGIVASALAADLATSLQVTGNVPLARAVYEKYERAFFLNREVVGFTQTRLEKLSLVGDPPPAIELEDLAGKPIDLSAYEGRVVLLDFWATNCGPCIEMIPELRRLYEELHPKGFEVVGLSLDRDGDLVTEFTESQKMPWRQALAIENGAKTVLTYHAGTIPTLYLVDRSGRIAAADVRGAELETLIRRLVADATPEEPTTDDE